MGDALVGIRGGDVVAVVICLSHCKEDRETFASGRRRGARSLAPRRQRLPVQRPGSMRDATAGVHRRGWRRQSHGRWRRAQTDEDVAIRGAPRQGSSSNSGVLLLTGNALLHQSGNSGRGRPQGFRSPTADARLGSFASHRTGVVATCDRPGLRPEMWPRHPALATRSEIGILLQ